ncbi:DMT family transporter [Nocardia sp. BMG51109]|uniref:DMT family transporter n=1 Tax=Nocardia sp. BMG51109 TaxID=1056816 RepID=UPI001E2EE718|nr:DMT family transporter [Nocardia sp. BMG51109]
MITLGPGAAGGALALLAALLFAVAAALQQSSARSAALARGESGTLAVLGIARTLLTGRRWLVGQGLSVAGFVCHAAALRYGAISTVQALLVVQLLFALPLAARRRRTRLLRRDWAGTVAVCAGLVLLVAQGTPHGSVRLERLPIAGCAVLGAVVVLLVLGRMTGGAQLRSALTAMAAGCCFATTAVLVTVATPVLPQLHWAWLGVPLTTVVGGVLTQEAFARGSLPTALTTMTITDPALSYIAGLTLFVTTAAQPHPAGVVAAAAVVVGGVVLLANSPTLHDERDLREPAVVDACTGVVAAQDSRPGEPSAGP